MEEWKHHRGNLEMRISFTYPDSPPATALITVSSAVFAAAIDWTVVPMFWKVEDTPHRTLNSSDHSRKISDFDTIVASRRNLVNTTVLVTTKRMTHWRISSDIIKMKSEDRSVKSQGWILHNQKIAIWRHSGRGKCVSRNLFVKFIVNMCRREINRVHENRKYHVPILG